MSFAPRKASPDVTSDLWSQALEALSQKDRDSLNIAPQSRVDDVLRILEERQTQSRDAAWTVRAPNNEIIVLRDVYLKLTKYVNRFVQVGDVVIQYDPAHAALPWAAIRLILMAAVNHADKDAVILSGVELITRLLPLGVIYEKLYLKATADAAQPLKEILSKVYQQCLSFLAKAIRFYTAGTIKRIKTSLTSFADSYNERLSNIEKEWNALDRLAHLAGVQIQQSVLEVQDENLQTISKAIETLSEPVERVEELSYNTWQLVSSTKKDEILRWISQIAYAAHQNEKFDRVMEGTGEWLLTKPEFTEWRRSSVSQIMWLHGDVGSGKSCLVSLIVHELMTDSKLRGSSLPSYFFCLRDTAAPERAEPLHILRALLRQIATPASGNHIDSSITDRFNQRDISGDITLSETISLLAQLASRRSITYLIVDALDECRTDRLWQLIDAFETLLQKTQGLLKIFVSSRNDVDIVCWLRDYPNHEINSSDNWDDIHFFVSSEVERRVNGRPRRLLPREKISDPLQSEIVRRISADASGMFRWAELQLDYICTLATEPKIRSRLGALPPTLDEIYSDIYANGLQSLDPEDLKISTLVFQLLLCSFTEISLGDFCSVVVKSFMSEYDDHEECNLDTVLHLTFNLVKYDEIADTFRFTHLSVREFLEKRSEFTQGQCHEAIAISLTRMLLRWHNEEDIEFLPYYFRRYWTQHIVGNRESAERGPVFHLLQEAFLEEDGILQSWETALFQRMLSPFNSGFPQTASGKSGLNFSCRYGLYALTQRLLMSRGDSVNEVNRFGISPLYSACEQGWYDCAVLLLDHGATTNPNELYPPICGAVANRHLELVRLLLRRDAGAYTSQVKMRSPLYIAADHEDWPILSALLTWDGDATVRDHAAGSSEDDKALLRVCKSKNPPTEIVKSLLARGASPNVPGISRPAPLLEAVKRGNAAVVECLIGAGADVNRCRTYYGTALQAAARNGAERLVQILLDAGARDDCKNNKNALSSAVESGSKTAVSLLLEIRATLDHDICRYASSALSTATRSDAEAMVRLLLDAGADANHTDKIFGSVLYCGAANGSTEICRLLLDHGAKVDSIPAGSLHTALEGATRNGHPAVMDLLIQRGASLDPPLRIPDVSRSKAARTLLGAAMLSGSVEAVKTLLRHGSDSQLQQWKAGEPLLLAISPTRIPMLQALLEDKLYGEIPASEYHKAIERTERSDLVKLQKHEREMVRHLLLSRFPG